VFVDADVLDACASVLVVLLHAAADAVHVPAALRDVEGVAVEDAGPRSRRAHLDLLARAHLVEPLQTAYGFCLLLVRHQAEVALEVLAPVEDRLLSRLRRRQRVAPGLEEAEPRQESSPDGGDRRPSVDVTLEELAEP
jgi:hypothetical protein